jgi:hypothetical protein
MNIDVPLRLGGECERGEKGDMGDTTTILLKNMKIVTLK